MSQPERARERYQLKIDVIKLGGMPDFGTIERGYLRRQIGPAARTVTIIERASRDVVASFSVEAGHGGQRIVAAIHDEHMSDDADDWHHRWIVPIREGRPPTAK